VEYLQNYIELQRLRISEKVMIQFVITGSPETKMVEPMLLIPFVENAFKHGVSYLEDSQIIIRLDITSDHLQFRIENNMIRKIDDPVQQESGIGLKNVLRRLELIYPGQHSIRIDENGTKYVVDLEIRFER
jgi:LytS/YehU family sensor histidine kinase